MNNLSNLILSLSTLVATVFVALQAWYARVQLVDASETRLLERKLDVCFDAFDSAVALDAALRAQSSGRGTDTEWPPRIAIQTGPELVAFQIAVIPHMDQLEADLTKAGVLSPLDRFRLYLLGEIKGLSARLSQISPARMGEVETDTELEAIFDALSNFLSAQYAVLEGCRLVAKGDV